MNSDGTLTVTVARTDDGPTLTLTGDTSTPRDPEHTVIIGTLTWADAHTLLDEITRPSGTLVPLTDGDVTVTGFDRTARHGKPASTSYAFAEALTFLKVTAVTDGIEICGLSPDHDFAPWMYLNGDAIKDLALPLLVVTASSDV